RLRIDESVSDCLRGGERVGPPKTDASVAHVWLPQSIQTELDYWMQQMKDRHPEAFLFPAVTGTPMSPKNFLNRHLKPAVETVLAKMKEECKEIPAGFLRG